MTDPENIADNQMKILLIRPHYHNICNPVIVSPMGLLYISAYAKKILGNQIRVSLLDLRLSGHPAEDLGIRIKQVKPDIIGISLMDCDAWFLGAFMPLIKSLAPGALTIIGGPHATYNYAHSLENHPVDIAVIGEGEVTFAEIVQQMIRCRPVWQIKGIAYKTNDKIKVNEKRKYIQELDTLPFPDYSLIDFDTYCSDQIRQMNHVLSCNRFAQVMSSRGCPYNCIYCHDIFGKQARNRSPEHFVREISMLYNEYGIREFHITDDIFNLRKNRMYAIMKLIKETGPGIRLAFPNGLRGDILDYKDIRMLKDAGAYVLTLAVESGSMRMQREIRKNLNIEKVAANIQYANSLGLITIGYFMLGFPQETTDEINSTIRFALSSKLDIALFHIVTPFKGTALYEICKSRYMNPDENRHFSFVDSSPYYQELTGYNLKRMQQLAYLRFYTPLRVCRLFRKIPRKNYYLRHFLKAGTGVLRI